MHKIDSGLHDQPSTLTRALCDPASQRYICRTHCPGCVPPGSMVPLHTNVNPVPHNQGPGFAFTRPGRAVQDAASPRMCEVGYLI